MQKCPENERMNVNLQQLGSSLPPLSFIIIFSLLYIFMFFLPFFYFHITSTSTTFSCYQRPCCASSIYSIIKKTVVVASLHFNDGVNAIFFILKLVHRPLILLAMIRLFIYVDGIDDNDK